MKPGRISNILSMNNISRKFKIKNPETISIKIKLNLKFKIKIIMKPGRIPQFGSSPPCRTLDR
jgi:hypothetical protein